MLDTQLECENSLDHIHQLDYSPYIICSSLRVACWNGVGDTIGVQAQGVPEPSSSLLAAFASLALLTRRKR